jgi:hypothetical protein
MRHLAARASVVVGLATALLTPAMPARATSVLTFTADIAIDGFGFAPGAERNPGIRYGEAWLCLNGVAGNQVVLTAGICSSVTGHGSTNAHTYFSTGQTLCPAVSTATGTVTGAATTTFYWTRVGAVAVITTSGGSIGSGQGLATFAVTDPLGYPCGVGGTVRATATGWISVP